MRTERLRDGHHWLRVADPAWQDPLDPTFAAQRGGRWNPPDSFPTLYVNEDVVTARLNLRAFIANWPYEPEDLRDDTGPILVAATLPSGQHAVDVHTPEGVAAIALPTTYPLDETGALVGHATCQPIGAQAHEQGLRGVRCRSAQTPDGAGRELAWFPAGRRSRARRQHTLPFETWFWG
ncbi:RES domain-containing protein [Egibacter rhizosphaerae]|uniref:RES domain-containing protein n=1 Tax=Egibacter rhizosphaerae TaxID=1670831 RepID=A0A411YE58_9ACTN|nr:RES family NAD+ phosphorylase [Egibacter rhizosphaerae]QBI19534.1 RES domain-containing protein [Egibacter rhizosphaerae]